MQGSKTNNSTLYARQMPIVKSQVLNNIACASRLVYLICAGEVEKIEIRKDQKNPPSPVYILLSLRPHCLPIHTDMLQRRLLNVYPPLNEFKDLIDKTEVLLASLQQQDVELFLSLLT